MLNRWPLHPPPLPNESLSSWISRIASRYNIYLEDLLWNEFAISVEGKDAYYLDLNPPLDLLTKLSERTGLALNAIRVLTAQGYTPLLIDTIETTKANIFNDYIDQYCIFPGKRKNFLVSEQEHWIPWLINAKHSVTIRGCRLCLDEDPEPYVRLHWQFLWMMTCPKHKVLLKTFLFYKAEDKKMSYLFADRKDVNLQYSLDALFALDSITLQAVAAGVVKVPFGTLHGGVWLRILRTLIEELNSPGKIIGQRNRLLMIPFWKELKLSIRQGFGKYTLFEKCNNDTQLILMLVASLVVKAIFTKHINFSSEIVKLLAPATTYKNDIPSIYSGLIKQAQILEEEKESSPSEILNKFSKQMDELIVLLRSDSQAVISFSNMMKAIDSKEIWWTKINQSLKKLGIDTEIS